MVCWLAALRCWASCHVILPQISPIHIFLNYNCSRLHPVRVSDYSSWAVGPFYLKNSSSEATNQRPTGQTTCLVAGMAPLWGHRHHRLMQPFWQFCCSIGLEVLKVSSQLPYTVACKPSCPNSSVLCCYRCDLQNCPDGANIRQVCHALLNLLILTSCMQAYNAKTDGIRSRPA